MLYLGWYPSLLKKNLRLKLALYSLIAKRQQCMNNDIEFITYQVRFYLKVLKFSKNVTKITSQLSFIQ